MDNVFNHEVNDKITRANPAENSAKLNNILSHDKYENERNGVSNYKGSKNEVVAKDLPPREIEYPLIDFDEMVNTPRTRKAIQQEMERYKALERAQNKYNNHDVNSGNDEEEEEDNIYQNKVKYSDRKYSEERAEPQGRGANAGKQKMVLKEKKGPGAKVKISFYFFFP